MINTILELSAFIGIFGLGFYLFLKNIRIGLYFLTVSSVLLHKELFSFYRWDFLPIRAFMFGMFFSSVFRLFILVKNKKLTDSLKDFVKEPFLVLLLLLWFVRGISILFSLNLQASLLLYGFFTTVVTLGIVLQTYFKDKPEEIIKYIKAYVFVAFGLSLFGFYQYLYNAQTGKVIGSFWVIPGNIPRVGSLFWDVNHYGALLAALLPISAVLILIEKKIKSKLLYVVISTSLLLSLLLTNSRTSWILDAVAFLLFTLIIFIKRFGLKGLLLVGFIGIVFSSIPLYMYNMKGSIFRERVKQYFNYRVDSSDSHMLLVTGAFQIFERYPFLGGGYGSFFEQFSKTPSAPIFYGRDPAALTNRVPAHTIWGELIAETGMIGASVFLLFVFLLLGSFAYSTLISKDKAQTLFSAAMFGVSGGWLVAGVFYSYNSEFYWIITFLFFLYAYSKIRFSEMVTYFIKSRIPFIGLFTICITLLFIQLSKNSLIPWDEAIYAKIAKNMVNTGNYMFLHWIPGKIWYEKPPLFMWILSFSFKLFGFTSLAAKLPTVLASIITLVSTYFFTKKLFGRVAAYVSVLSLITTVQYLFYSRMAMTDVMCALFISTSLFLYFLQRQIGNKFNYKYLIIGLLIGLAVMTKGVVGLLPFPIIFLYECYLLVSKQETSLVSTLKNLFVVLFIAVLVFMPWHYLMYKSFGQSFLGNYIGYHVIERATENIENKQEPIYWYIIILKVSMRLWFISLIAAIPFVLYKLSSATKITEKNKLVYLLIWSLFILVFFSIPKSKLVWYITPIYIPLAILNGYFIYQAYTLVSSKFKIFTLGIVKFLVFYIFTFVILGYTFMVRNMIYVTDNTGAIADLLKLKDIMFGKAQFAYLDRVELPLAYYYTDGPFQVLDFNAQKPERVPLVGFNSKLVLITKDKRYVTSLPSYEYTSTFVKQEGDYILWYFDSKRSYYESRLEDINTQLNQLGKDPIKNAVEYKRLTAEALRIQKILEIGQ